MVERQRLITRSDDGFSSEGEAELRRSLQQDFSRYRALSRKTVELGLEPPIDPGMRDWLHLENRICSLCVEPHCHLVQSDSRASLGWSGFRESQRDRGLSWRRRVMLSSPVSSCFAERLEK